tara:strand:+ start:763 stop:1512 length:750 start_codon:yes stop_codon:yes gene_type:complete
MNYLITGATSGLGNAIFKKLSLNVDDNFYLISRNVGDVKSEELNKKNVKVYNTDLRNVKNTQNIVNKILQDANDRIDVLICNAAEGSFGNINEVPTEDFINNLNTNFLSHLVLIKSIYPKMKKNDFGHIINISSGAAVFGFTNTASYSTSKSCMQILIESMYMENIKNNIHTKNIFPGLIDTDFETKNKVYNNIDKIPLFKKKDKNKIAEIIISKMFKKKLNIFCQLNPFLAFIIKVFPAIEKIRKLIL